MAQQLTEDKVVVALAGLDGWKRAGDAIEKTFKFEDFPKAMAFVNRVAEEAEAAQHHPDIDIRWNQVTMSLSRTLVRSDDGYRAPTSLTSPCALRTTPSPV